MRSGGGGIEQNIHPMSMATRVPQGFTTIPVVNNLQPTPQEPHMNYSMTFSPALLTASDRISARPESHSNSFNMDIINPILCVCSISFVGNPKQQNLNVNKRYVKICLPDSSNIELYL